MKPSSQTSHPVAAGLLLGTAGAAGYELVRRAANPGASDKLQRLPSSAMSMGIRNASWWAIKTPGVILDEMRAAKSEIEALGRDVYAMFRRPFEQQLALATTQFVAKFKRPPGVGRAARDDDDRVVRSMMKPEPTDADWEHKSYQGLFVFQWGAFEHEFADFWAAHADSWTDRMWRGSYDKAVEFRQRALAWRDTFIAAGGHPTTPAPKPPRETLLPDIGDSWKTIALVGGISIGALFLIPAAFRAVTR